MGMNRKYSGFTLVEMLIVMGIIIILMAVGITAGRFAINRANDVAHQNAANQIYVAAQSYLTDTREFPVLENTSFEEAFQESCVEADDQPCLYEYLSEGEFKGGTDATFYYGVSTDFDSILVCVSLGGVGDATERGFFCTGNGFSDDDIVSGVITEKEIPNAGDQTTPGGFTGWDATMTWTNQVGDGASHWSVYTPA